MHHFYRLLFPAMSLRLWSIYWLAAMGMFMNSQAQGSFKFTSQSQIDQFAGAERMGDLIITHDSQTNPDTILSLAALQGVRYIGRLFIESNPLLQSLKGLESLDSLGALFVKFNPRLQSLEGLGGLQGRIGRIEIVNNPALRSIAGLRGLHQVSGDLHLLRVDSLQSLQGLDSLRSVGKDLVIARTAIDNLNPLTALRSIGEGLYISGNPYLVHVDGLHRLTVIPFNLEITFNQALEQIDGMGRLFKVGGAITIYRNPSLINLEGFANLKAIGDRLEINNNDQLSNLDPLLNLDSAHISLLQVIGNENLVDINGLCNLRGRVSASFLVLVANPKLEVCGSLLPWVSSPTASLEIQDNAPACNSQTAIEQQKPCPPARVPPTAMGQIFPHPLQEDSVLPFSIGAFSEVQIDLLDLRGRLVQRLYEQATYPGSYRIPIQLRGLPAGLYLYRMKTASYQKLRKLRVE